MSRWLKILGGIVALIPIVAAIAWFVGLSDDVGDIKEDFQILITDNKEAIHNFDTKLGDIKDIVGGTPNVAERPRWIYSAGLFARNQATNWLGCHSVS
jgi:hypothetical protein